MLFGCGAQGNPDGREEHEMKRELRVKRLNITVLDNLWGTRTGVEKRIRSALGQVFAPLGVKVRVEIILEEVKDGSVSQTSQPAG